MKPSFQGLKRQMSSIKIDQLIIKDHQKVKGLYSRYCQSMDNEEKHRLANTIIREISLHSAAEEVILYPAFEKFITSGGTEMAKLNRSEHAQLKRDLYDLDQMNFTDGRFNNLLVKIMNELTSHMEHEESHDLGKLTSATTNETLDSLGKSFENSKYLAPTRPHPSAPDTPVLETLAGLAAKPIDKLRDMTRKFEE